MEDISVAIPQLRTLMENSTFVDNNHEYNLDADNDSYHEPSNFRISSNDSNSSSGEHTNKRRVTIAEDLPVRNKDIEYPPDYNEGKQRCRSRYSTFIAGINQFDPYQELTATQIAAFRQVFDMVDRDGGGSIDADELYLSMKDLESGLRLEEIKEILEELDRDGNGEIDFEEFLYMMTSMSLQIKEAQEDNVLVKQGKRRQSIFFSVITKFAMKHSLKEIEHYYASKAKRSPHVVGHYAAGARVFGLTDKELRKTWKEFSHASRGMDSPYAQPLNFVVDDHNGKCTVKKTVRAVQEKKNIHNSQLTSSTKKFVFKLKTTANKQTGLRRSSCANDSAASTRRQSVNEKETRSASDSPTFQQASSASPSNRTNSARSVITLISEKRDGWTPRHRLPITKVKLPKFTYIKEKKLTIRDMDKIRQRVNDARVTYYNHLSEERGNKAKEYWKSLKTEQITSDRLQTNFKKVFRCYSPSNDQEGTISPRRCKSPQQDLDAYRSNGGFVF